MEVFLKKCKVDFEMLFLWGVQRLAMYPTQDFFFNFWNNLFQNSWRNSRTYLYSNLYDFFLPNESLDDVWQVLVEKFRGKFPKDIWEDFLRNPLKMFWRNLWRVLSREIQYHKGYFYTRKGRTKQLERKFFKSSWGHGNIFKNIHQSEWNTIA